MLLLCMTLTPNHLRLIPLMQLPEIQPRANQLSYVQLLALQCKNPLPHLRNQEIGAKHSSALLSLELRETSTLPPIISGIPLPLLAKSPEKISTSDIATSTPTRYPTAEACKTTAGRALRSGRAQTQRWRPGQNCDRSCLSQSRPRSQ